MSKTLQNRSMLAMAATLMLATASAHAQQAPAPHTDHCQKPQSAASSGKTDCEVSAPADSGRQPSNDSSSPRATPKAATPSPTTSPPPRPEGPNKAAAASAQTPPRPV